MSVNPTNATNSYMGFSETNPSDPITGQVEGQNDGKQSRIEKSMALATIQVAIGTSVQVGGAPLATPYQIMGNPQTTTTGSSGDAKKAESSDGDTDVKVGKGSDEDGWTPESLMEYVEEHPEFAAKAKDIAEREGFTDIIPEIEEKIEEHKAETDAKAKAEKANESAEETGSGSTPEAAEAPEAPAAEEAPAEEPEAE